MDEFGTLLEEVNMTWTDAAGGSHPVKVEISQAAPATSLDNVPAGLYRANVRLTGFGARPVHPVYADDAATAVLFAKCTAGKIVANSAFAAKLSTANLPNYGFPEFPAPPSGGGGSGGGSGGQTGGEGIAAAGCGCGQ